MSNRRGDASNVRRNENRGSRNRPRSSRQAAPIITLLTDFGTTDYFVGAVKGAILSINPRVRIVDITHDITAHDVEAAAFILLNAHSAFPAGTIHVVVVDPGVGSSRRPLLVGAADQYFIGPDNGIFSYVCECFGAELVVHLTNDKYFRKPVSQTFNGRDIFAPVAAAVSTGIAPQLLGDVVEDYVRLESLTVSTNGTRTVAGRIIHVDHFGNCITNLTRDIVQSMGAGVQLRVKGHSITEFRNYFAESSSATKLFGVWGSAGFLEIAARNESAARIGRLKRGDKVVLESA